MADLVVGNGAEGRRRDPLRGRSRRGFGNAPPIGIDGGTGTTSF